MTSAKPNFTAYQLKLFVFLSVATFFEGYDFLALSQILTELSRDYGLDKNATGNLVAFINAGTIVAFLLVRKADGWGRRRVLTLTIAGYTIFTCLTGLSWDIYSFAVFQFIARVFLIAEWATAMVYAAEEFPASRRGTVIGVISAFATLGSITCAGIAPMLVKLDIVYPVTGELLGWRAVYFVGILPLIVLAIARRGLKESRRFVEFKTRQKESSADTRAGFLSIIRGPHRKRVLQLALIWGIAYVATHNAVTFWKDFAQTERGLTGAEAGTAITVAAVASMPLVFAVGKLLDTLGRRYTAVLVFVLTSAGVFFAYTLHGQWALTVPLAFGIFGTAAVLPVLNAFTTELFPTEVRADAFAWSNQLLGRISYVVSPSILGMAASSSGQWGPTLQVTAVFPIVAVVLIMWWLPETNAKELD